MADAEDLKALGEEVERLRIAMKEQKEYIQKQEQSWKEAEPRPVVMMSGRRLDRFRDRSTSSSEPSITEWVSDMRSQAKSRKLTAPEFSIFLLDNLAGKARQEILGRGEALHQDPEGIIKILFKVFGDGDSLPILQQRFYAYKQKEEDLITCSLNMVKLYDKIVQLDQSFAACRDASLKGRFAETVKDEGLRRELRRLNIETPTLEFFELRDRAVHWMGREFERKSAINQEIKIDKRESDLLEVVKRQESLIERQQEQINQMLLSRPESEVRRPRKCWNCGSSQHLKYNCPKPVKDRHQGSSLNG